MNDEVHESDKQYRIEENGQSYTIDASWVEDNRLISAEECNMALRGIRRGERYVYSYADS